MDPQLSYVRLLIGDNSRTDPFYTDAQIKRAAQISPARAPFPLALRISGIVGAIRYPDLNPPNEAELSLAALTDDQLAALTDAELASMVN